MKPTFGDRRLSELAAFIRTADGEQIAARAMQTGVRPAKLATYTDQELYEALERLTIQLEGARR